MLFKILRGPSTRISKDKTEFHDGYAYFTPDDGGFYIDAEDTDTGAQNRIRVNPVMEHQDISGLLNKTGDASNTTATFTAPSARENIKTGEKLSVIMGKIAKWFSSLGTLAFKSSVAKSDLAADVQTSLGKADTVPTKVSELTNDANYITADQAPVKSVNGKAGAVTLSATDVSAIPSTLTGTAGQVLTKTVDGQEWKNLDNLTECYFNTNGTLFEQNLTVDDASNLSMLAETLNEIINTGAAKTSISTARPCLMVYGGDTIEEAVVLKYTCAGDSSDTAIFGGVLYDASGDVQYAISLVYRFGASDFEQYNVVELKTTDPSDIAPLAPTAAGAVGASMEYARGDHRHPKELPNVTTSDNGKFLRVVNGAWAAVEIANANGGSF